MSPAVVGSEAAAKDNGDSTEVAGEGACSQSAGTAGGANAAGGLDGELLEPAEAAPVGVPAG